MGIFTHVTTNLRAKRAAVVLYAVTLVGLAAFGDFVLAPNAVWIEARSHLLPYLSWATIVIGLVALAIVIQISRGRLDPRLNWVSLWLVLANLALIGFYLVVFWKPIREVLHV